MSAPFSVLKFVENSISPLAIPVDPITTLSAEIFPSKCPYISTWSASIAPETEPVSFITSSLEKTGPLTRPAISIAPELFTVPSILTVSLIRDLSESLILFFSYRQTYYFRLDHLIFNMASTNLSFFDHFGLKFDLINWHILINFTRHYNTKTYHHCHHG